MLRTPVVLASALALAWTGSELTREAYQFDVSDVERIDVDVTYALGSLRIKAGEDEKLVEGFIEYDSDYVTPHVDYHTLGSKGKLDIRTESLRHSRNEDEWSFDVDWKNLHEKDYESVIDFKLPRLTPLDMNLDFGLGKTDIDLSYLTVSEFRLDCGLSDVKVIMTTPNRGTCRRVVIESGLGDFNATGLGNLKTEQLRLEVGMGSANIDLGPDITDDLEGEISVGLGSLDLTLPKNVNIRLQIERTFLSAVDVDIQGLVRQEDEWSSRDWDKNLPTVDLEISVGLGSVDVELR